MSTHVVMSTLKRSCPYGEVAALCSAWIGPPPKALPALPQHAAQLPAATCHTISDHLVMIQ